MIPIKIIDKYGSIMDSFMNDDFYNFIMLHLHVPNIYVFGNKFITDMFDLYVKSFDKDYSVQITNLPSILSCYD